MKCIKTRSLFRNAIRAAVLVGLMAATPATTKVYICDSAGSYAYHLSKSCSGLRHCKHQILIVTKDEAINTYGRKACKICAR